VVAVFGRESELALADGFLDSVPERFGVLRLEGEAGIGKTTVWQEVAHRAEGRWLRVLRCRPAETETKHRLRPAAGQTVRFVEQGARTYRQIGVARRRAGAIRFAPASGARGRRRIVALIEQDGLTVERRNVARYSAPADARPAKPRRLRVRRRGGTLRLRWRRVRGVDDYGVVVRLSNRRRIFRVARRPRLTLRGFHRLARGWASVQALRVGGRASRPATARIRPIRRKRARPPQGRRRDRGTTRARAR
jgi:hypothetical protein